MTDKIAVIASSINPIRQKHLLEWHEDMSNKVLNTQLFLGSKNTKIALARSYKINSTQEKLKHTIWNLISFKKEHPPLAKIQPLVSYNPKIIHLLTSNAFTTIEPILKDENVKLIVSFRGFDINIFPKLSEENLKLTQRIFKKADVLHFISKNLMDKAVQMNADSEKCVVIHRSIRTEIKPDFERTRLKNNKIIIVSVGRLVWEKGYIYALETVSILKEKGYNFEYQIAGSGVDYNMLVFHAQRLKIEDQVRFLGEITPTEVKNKLKNADIYLQPSVIEALSLAIIEASYYGLPIVSSNIGGIPEIVEDRVSGFLSASCNPIAYAKSIEKLIESEDLRKKMGLAGNKHILEGFSREMEIQKWKELYTKLGSNLSKK